MSLKSFLKKILKLSPIALSKNHGYDLITKKIFHKVLTESSNCIDVGCHKGEILDLMYGMSPKGTHFGFEPIPNLYQDLQDKYATNANCNISSIALSNKKGEANFNYVVSNPSYSGLKKRSYDKKNELDKIIKVQTEKLDKLIPSDLKIDMIKIDVEGGELLVLEGAEGILSMDKPIVIFEHGLGASDHYNYGPQDVFSFFNRLDYQIYTLIDFLTERGPLSEDALSAEFYGKKNYYFIASTESFPIKKGRT